MTINLPGMSFHNTMDLNVNALAIYRPQPVSAPITSGFITTYNLNLTYKFYPHFHPYVTQLARELSDTDSVFDLLAMNVLYQPNSDGSGSIQAISNSTRAILSSLPTGVQLLDGNQKQV